MMSDVRQGRAGRLSLQSQAIAPRLATVLLCCLQAWLFWYAHGHYYLGHPGSAVLGDNWWGWLDQGHYLSAALALAHGDLAASQYWYEPGYSLLAAPFARLGVADPFFVPDMACYVLSGWLFARLGRTLLGGFPWAGPLSLLCFIATTAWRPAMLEIWVVPWTTTATTPMTLGALLAAVRFARQPGTARCFLAALLACGIGLFRPSDGPVLAVPVGLFLLACLFGRQVAGRRLPMVVAGLAGGAVSLLAMLGLHAAIWGPHLGPYIEQSQQTGFEWALVPLRWVLIMCGPRPLLNDGAGLAQMFPWLIPGVAGAAAAILSPGRKVHALIVVTLAGQTVMLLAYRDMQPTGLWRFANYHYFKFVIPMLGLYSLFLLKALAERRRRAFVLPGVAVAAALFLWRPDLAPHGGSMGAQVTGPHSLLVTQGRPDVTDGVLVPARGSWASIVMARHPGATGEGALATNLDYKAYTHPGGLLLVPLRTLPPRFTVDFDPDVTFEPDARPVMVRQHAVFGLPCWLRRCPGTYLLPAPPLPLGHAVPFDPAAEPYVAGGWSSEEAAGRWTTGSDARLRATVPGPLAGRTLTLRLRGTPRPAPDDPIARIEILANGHRLGTWAPNALPGQEFVARFPATFLSPEQELVIDLHMRNPRSLQPGIDPRRLGIYLQEFGVDVD